jgi:hypothetical protein
MDDNKLQQPTNNESQDNTDQYQEVLNKYAETATPASNPESDLTVSNNLPAIETPQTPLIIEKNEIPPVLSQNIEIENTDITSDTNIESPLPPKPEKTPEEIRKEIDELLDTPTQGSELTNSAPLAPVSGGNFFKTLFFISLLIFLGVAGLLAYATFISPKQSVNTETNTSNSVVTPTTTVNSSVVCTLNDLNLKINETFIANDGCNTCTCNADKTITCTEKTCPTTIPTKSATSSSTNKKVIPTVTISPTKTATTSAK